MVDSTELLYPPWQSQQVCLRRPSTTDLFSIILTVNMTKTAKSVLLSHHADRDVVV